MEIILVSAAIIIVFLVLGASLKEATSRIRELERNLQKLSDNTIGSWSKHWDKEPPSVPERLRRVNNTIESLSRTVLPLIKPDIDKVIKIDYPGCSFKELDTRSSGVVVRMKHPDGGHVSELLVTILDRAEGLKQIEDQLCPSKCKSRKAKG